MATVASYRLTCRCGAATEARPPLGRQLPNGWKCTPRNGRGWTCPPCQAVTCAGCERQGPTPTTADYADKGMSGGWRLAHRSRRRGWYCPECLSLPQMRGFASMSPERQKAIASKGGKKAHALGVAHQWTVEDARAAGRMGGKVSRGGRGKAAA